MPRECARVTWVSYLRVSTVEQAERNLSIPAQRAAVDEYARTHGAVIAREYVDAGASGRSAHRPEFRRMIDDVSARGSDIGTIVVNHSSRFTRDAMQACVIKRRLRRLGVRVISACQEAQDDPGGHLVERMFECFDEYESEINGARTAAAMREAIRQGFYPGTRAPFGYSKHDVESRPGVTRHVLVPAAEEAAIVREMFRLYIASNGAKSVARTLNQRGLLHRGARWSSTAVFNVLGDETVTGTFYWGRHATRDRIARPRAEWIALRLEPIVDRATFDLAQRLRSGRRSREARGASSPPHVLSGVVHCGKCGASYQIETSGKRVEDGVYRYCYYNCRTACRIGREACAGLRIPTRDLDAAVLSRIADVVCTPARAEALRRSMRLPHVALDELVGTWRALITNDPSIGRTYVRRLADRIIVYENRIVIEPRAIADQGDEIRCEDGLL